MTKLTEHPTKIFAHRGSKCNRPENTLAAFREALRVGADGIELDVHLSTDGQLVVIHDETLERTTNGKGDVKDYSLEQLRTFDAGGWYNSDFAGEKIPTLAEVLQLLTDAHFTGALNIELKTDKFPYSGIVETLSKQMTAQDWPFQHIYSSFNFQSLRKIKRLEPQTEVAYLFARKPWAFPRGLFTHKVESLHPYKGYLPFIGLTRKPIRFWTVNEEADMLKVLQARVAGLITDFPERAIALRDQLEKAGK